MCSSAEQSNLKNELVRINFHMHKKADSLELKIGMVDSNVSKRKIQDS